MPMRGLPRPATTPTEKAGRNFACAIFPPSWQFALGLGRVDAERIEFGYLMQETFLRRHRYDHAAIGEQDRLPKLQVPVPQSQPLTFEGGDGKVLSLDEA